MMDAIMNVGRRLSVVACAMPDAVAVVEPLDYDARGKRRYRHVTFRQLDDDSDRIARGLHTIGVTPGTRTGDAGSAGHRLHLAGFRAVSSRERWRF